MEKFWFAHRIFDEEIDLSPRETDISGPYESYNKAKKSRLEHCGQGVQKTNIFSAESLEEAEKKSQLEGFKKW